MIGSELCVTEQSSNREPENLEAGVITRYRTRLGKRGAWPPFLFRGRRRKEEWLSSGPVVMGISFNCVIEGEFNGKTGKIKDFCWEKSDYSYDYR